MTPHKSPKALLLLGSSLITVCVFQAAPALAQDQDQPTSPSAAPQAQDDEQPAQATSAGTIIVQGQRQRGQLDVEQAPLLELNQEDIAAEGVTSIADLVTQLTEQTGSARGRSGGGRPIILVNGLRIGSFREIRNYPPEALEKVEVFPEEVAQRFGFPPDRRVMNLILKDNYRNAEVELEFEGPSSGGYHRREQELGFLQIADGGRFNFNFEANDTSLLTEDERDIEQTSSSVSNVAGDPDQAPFRSLIADSRSLDANLSWARAYRESGISLSANANYERNDSRSLQGLNFVTLEDGAGNSAIRTFGEDTPLEQRTASDTFSLAGSLTKPVGNFLLTSTLNGSLAESETEIDQRIDTQQFEDDAMAGLLALDGDLPRSVDGGFEVARSRALSGDTLHTLRGPLADLPGGELLATFDVGYSWQQLETSDTSNNSDISLTRGDLSAGTNLVIPITSRRNGFADALGSFTLNGQIGINHLSDFGTLGDYSVGLNWSPFDNLDMSATYIEREVAPGLGALGNPLVVTPNVAVFDFVNGETVLATVTTGGNPDLLAETQSDWKFGANWQLPFWERARLSVEYIRNKSSDVTSSFPALTEEIQNAFSDRVTRDANGTLTELDRRSVTFAETRANRLRFGLNFRGSIGAGESGAGGRGGPGGGPGAGPRRGAPGGGPPPGPAGAGRPPPDNPVGPNGPQNGEASSPENRRAAFMRFRERVCGEDGMDMLNQLVEAARNGQDPSTIVPGMTSRRLERLLSRVRNGEGNVDPARFVQLRERMCSSQGDQAGPAGRRGPPRGDAEAGQGERRGPSPGPAGEMFTAFRNILCGDDGETRVRALIARIEAGEDVSDQLPGFDPDRAGFIIDRLRGDDGTISSQRIAGARSRFCGQNAGGQADASNRAPAFNPLARRSFRGFRYFVNVNHQIELDNTILIATGLEPLDQLDGEATSSFGLPRHSSRLDAGIFGGGVGMRFTARYIGETRLDGSASSGSSDIFFNDLATFDLRIFAMMDRLFDSESDVLRNMRVSLRTDNIFDAKRRIVDENGDTPINYQPDLIDPTGRYIGIDIRKLF